MIEDQTQQLSKLCGRLLHKTAYRNELVTSFGASVLELAEARGFVTKDFFNCYGILEPGRAFFNATPKAVPPVPTLPAAPEPVLEPEPTPPVPALDSGQVTQVGESRTTQPQPALTQPTPTSKDSRKRGAMRNKILLLLEQSEHGLTMQELADQTDLTIKGVWAQLKKLLAMEQVFHGAAKPFRYQSRATPPVALQTAPAMVQEAPVKPTAATEGSKLSARDRVRTDVLNCLQTTPQTFAEISQQLGGESSKSSYIAATLKSLAESGEIERTGEGLAGRPYRYAKLIPDSIPRPPVLKKLIAGTEVSAEYMDEQPSTSVWSEPHEISVSHHGTFDASDLVEGIRSRVLKLDPELEAMKSIIDALEPLNRAVQDRVMQWVGKRLGLM